MNFLFNPLDTPHDRPAKECEISPLFIAEKHMKSNARLSMDRTTRQNHWTKSQLISTPLMAPDYTENKKSRTGVCAGLSLQAL